MKLWGLYEFAKTTQRMCMLVHMTKAIRRSPLPYVYLSKEVYEGMGGVYPPKDEKGQWMDPDPAHSFRITVESWKEFEHDNPHA